MDWVYSVVHSGVVSHEVDNLIWVILCGFQVGGKSASRTLVRNQKFLLSNLLVYLIHGSSNIYIICFNSQCQVEGRGFSQCMAPTDSWGLPCGQMAH